MSTTQNLRRSAFALLPALLLGLAACATDVETSDVDVAALPATSASVPATSAVAVRIEQAERMLDVGRDAATARDTLAQVLADEAATADERDEARLGLSRALEALGDREAATKTIEDLLAAHAADAHWARQSRAEARLRELVTGSAAEPSKMHRQNDEPVAPFARVLTRYFHPDADGTTQVKLITFHDETDDTLGVFNVAGAIKAMRTEACPLCDDDVHVWTHSDGEGSWVAIPKYRDQLGAAVVAYYVDLGAGRIPARYDAYLPLPWAQIEEHLQRGEGLVAARERTGAPPVLVVAAPREAELPNVEAALAQMTALPATPVVVPLDPGLRPLEIKEAVRSKYPALRACYEALRRGAPEAGGKVELAFAVTGDGRVEDARVETDAAALRDPTFQRCVLDATNALAFPATGQSSKTTVRYPIALSAK